MGSLWTNFCIFRQFGEAQVRKYLPILFEILFESRDTSYERVINIICTFENFVSLFLAVQNLFFQTIVDNVLNNLFQLLGNLRYFGQFLVHENQIF